jgi:hypothetical protein
MIIFDTKRCNLTLEVMEEADIGDWSCRVHHSLSHHFQVRSLVVCMGEGGDDDFGNLREKKNETYIAKKSYDKLKIAGKYTIDLNFSLYFSGSCISSLHRQDTD